MFEKIIGVKWKILKLESGKFIYELSYPFKFESSLMKYEVYYVNIQELCGGLTL